ADAVRSSRIERPPASIIALAYLLVTLPLLFRGEMDGPRATALAIHLVAIVMLGITWWRPSAGRPGTTAGWLPLVLVPVMYGELPYLMAAGPGGNVPFNDPLVMEWEHALFGAQPAQSLAAAIPGTLVSELLHFGYLSYYAIVFLPPLLLFLRGDRRGFDLSAAVVMATFALCFLVFALWPVEGPRYRWAAPAGIADGPVRTLVLMILERGSSRGAAFPSSHAAVAVAQSVVLLHLWPRLGALVGVLTALLLVGAVHGGFHYGVDMVAGTVLGAGVGLLGLAARRPDVLAVRWTARKAA
ncbi:MAG TPA: phosphatase PAP2 family protein, partial [Gemmatimonadaceae bacterium]|nr:phosphatase PAP2 family protein [Gemmatimonadaceae bacterium]